MNILTLYPAGETPASPVKPPDLSAYRGHKMQSNKNCEHDQRQDRDINAVSYTHLTLPTICSV